MLKKSHSRKCIGCEKRFNTKYKTKIFCTPECRTKFWNNKMTFDLIRYTKRCRECLNEFKTHRINQFFCKSSCYREFNRKKLSERYDKLKQFESQ